MKEVEKQEIFGHKRHIEQIYKEIQEIYLSNNYPWVVGYSGGKDSTITLQLVWESLDKLPRTKLLKPVYILSSDTLVEIPKIVNFIDKNLTFMNKAAKEQGLPFTAVKLVPEITDTFWVNLIGRGYPAPTSEFRWCTDRLKIQPADKFILDTANKYGEVVVVLGLRKSESASREKSINQHKIESNRLSRHSTLPGAYVYTPIEDFYLEDVWMYLEDYPCPWGTDNNELIKLYKQSSAGECPLVIDNTTPSCGNSRFGCWVCTVVQKEKALSSMIESGEYWLKPLAEFRQILLDTQIPEKKHHYRDYKRRDGSVYFLRNKEKEGIEKLGRGPYYLSFRQELLRKLLEIQRNINKERKEEIELITREELIEIRRLWKLEEGDWHDSLLDIYEEVYHEKLGIPTEDIGIFLGEDKEILENLCNEENINPKW